MPSALFVALGVFSGARFGSGALFGSATAGCLFGSALAATVLFGGRLGVPFLTGASGSLSQIAPPTAAATSAAPPATSAPIIPLLEDAAGFRVGVLTFGSGATVCGFARAGFGSVAS